MLIFQVLLALVCEHNDLHDSYNSPFLLFKEKIMVVIEAKVECIAFLSNLTIIDECNRITRIAKREPGKGKRHLSNDDHPKVT